MQSWNIAASPTPCRREKMACLYSHCLRCRLPAASPFLYQQTPSTHLWYMDTKEYILNPAYCRRRCKRLWWFTTLLRTANTGLNFFSCDTARKTQAEFELSKKASTDFHSPEHSTVQRVMWVLLENVILSLTDGMAETILRMKSMKRYWTLISAASQLYLCCSGCQVILV